MSIWQWIFLAIAALLGLGGFAILNKGRGSIEYVVGGVLILVGIVIAGNVLAAPPAGGPGRYAEWYQSLKSPTGGSCCDLSDCREVAWRAGKGGYEARISPETHGNVGVTETFWLAIPDDRIIVPPEYARAFDRPPGAVACYRPGNLYCFVRGMEG